MNFKIKLRAENFDGEKVCCLGSQLVLIVNLVRNHLGDLNWYAVDVEVVGKFILPEGNFPQLIGPSSKFLFAIREVDQFLRGVFLGVPSKIPLPHFRESIDTEDPPDADLGDASIEIRAFDTTYFEILTTDSKIASFLADSFSVRVNLEENHQLAD